MRGTMVTVGGQLESRPAQATPLAQVTALAVDPLRTSALAGMVSLDQTVRCESALRGKRGGMKLAPPTLLTPMLSAVIAEFVTGPRAVHMYGRVHGRGLRTPCLPKGFAVLLWRRQVPVPRASGGCAPNNGEPAATTYGAAQAAGMGQKQDSRLCVRQQCTHSTSTQVMTTHYGPAYSVTTQRLDCLAPCKWTKSNELSVLLTAVITITFRQYTTDKIWHNAAATLGYVQLAAVCEIVSSQAFT